MNFKIKFPLIFAFILAIYFSSNFIFAGCADNYTKDQYEFKMGRITKIDYTKREIRLEDLVDLKITDRTFNVDNTLIEVDDNGKMRNIEELHKGLGLLVKYDKSDGVITDLWLLHNSEEDKDLINFIYIQEKRTDKIVQSYYLGAVDRVNIHSGNQVHLIINTQYLKQLSDITNKILKIEATVHIKGGHPDILQLPERVIKMDEIFNTHTSPIIYDMEELGLDEGNKIKIKVTLHEDQNEEQVKSSRELRLYIKKYGLRPYTYETISFVRDSFDKNWEPAPGASVTLGYTFFTWKRTPRFWKLCGKIWNAVDPRFGINLTLLDYDEDKNIEFGVGWVISILKGGIYFGSGWNISTNRRHIKYAFFGISLTAIAEKIKGQLSEKREK